MTELPQILEEIRLIKHELSELRKDYRFLYAEFGAWFTWQKEQSDSWYEEKLNYQLKEKLNERLKKAEEVFRCND
jgi:hypothetical protein